MIRTSLLASLAIIATGCFDGGRIAAQDTPAAGSAPAIMLDPGHSLGPVNRLIFGHNVEAGNSKGIFSSKVDSDDPRAGAGIWDVANHRPLADTVAWSKAIGMGVARYPGGCLAHNFDWKQAVGPLSTRTYFTFGIDEYLTFCRTVDAEPLMTVSELVDPADAAALIEYLNAPADAAHPWAQKRAAWGHTEPWHVRWFEMANESDHGNHSVVPSLRRTAAEYAEWVVACAASMRRMDPSIRIGAHVGTGTPVTDPWNRTVLTRVKTGIDFVAIHTYAIGSPGPSDSTEQVGRACMAATEQIGWLLADYRVLVHECTGADIPLAITEYNAGFTAPGKPWRYSFAAALHSADQMRLMLEPQTHVVMANYWQFLNGYWGFLRGSNIPAPDAHWKTTAAAPLFKLWGEHIGATLITSSVVGVPRLEFAGFQNVDPAHGDAMVPASASGSQPLVFSASDAAGAKIETSGPGAAVITIHGLTGKQYPSQPSFPVHASWTYRLSWEQRVDPASPQLTTGMGLCDVRGWNATKSACASSSGEALPDGWVRCTTEMRILADATALIGMLRLEGGDHPVDTRIEIRNATVTAITPRSVPAFAALTTHASLSADGKTMHLVVFNKHDDQATTVHVSVADGSARSAHAWCVSGPFEATNLEHEEVRETLGGAVVPDLTGQGFTWTFPAHSMTAFMIDR